MKAKRYLLMAMFGALTLVTSCRDDDPTTSTTTTTTTEADAINDFVWKAMNLWYYWQAENPNLADNLPADNAKYTTLINGRTPDDLFYKSLLYQYGNVDLYSWIENNNQVVAASGRMASEFEAITGLDLTLFPGSGDNYIAFVNYVVPNSSAASAGVKRGDVITKVNGSYINAYNYSALFDDSSFTITRAATTTVSVVNGSYQISTTDKSENLSIAKASVEENPIAFYKVFEQNGKKIGYLVYNAFKIEYNDELNAQFAKMKADGITDLILDLRYNSGGSLTSALGLAQMINGNYTGQNYLYMEYNKKNTKYSGYDVLSNKLGIYNLVSGHPTYTRTEDVNSLSLPKIYALVSVSSASASELTVICLSKLINVETIGYATSGKFVGSHTLYDSPNNEYISYENRNKAHNWQLQPITFKYFNKDRDAHPIVQYADGSTKEAILPSLQNRVHPFEWINNVKEFGETTDPELKMALARITGQATGRARATTFVDTPQKVITKPHNAAKGLHLDDMKSYLERKRD